MLQKLIEQQISESKELFKLSDISVLSRRSI